MREKLSSNSRFLESNSRSKLPPQLVTRGQMEREISQKIEALLHQKLSHRPTKITCCLNGKVLSVLIEDALTKPEAILVDKSKPEIVIQVRNSIEQALRPLLQPLLTEILEVEVLEIFCQTKLKTRRMSIVATLKESPKLRAKSNNYPKNQQS